MISLFGGILMFKKVLCLLFVAVLSFSACGCGKKTDKLPADTPVASNPAVQEDPFSINPLTGVKDLDKGKENLRPVAVMVDNDSIAQTNTQSGVSKADIVYETETEGGITRLMCVFKDVSKIPQIGDIRSARYVYVDLAMGHNAIYVHSGKDPDFCAPHLKDLDNFEVYTGYYAKRITYGAAKSWQTLFSDGATLAQGFSDKNWKTTEDKSENWQNFSDEQTPVTLSGGTANKVTAAFNSAYISYFEYNAENGKYTKTSRYATNKDRNDSASYSFKNVFVLKTDMSYYPGNYRRKISLDSGSGYYFSNGTAEEIKWSKGNSSSGFKFTKADGSPLTVNSGNSWVCIAKNSADISFS